jgi:ring-1,2-phenylacetyl-CoA epoxidase subunit PaaC
MLGDDALIMSHRLQQWMTHAPELEDELAIANLALDLLGQARLLLSRAAEVEGAGRDEDTLAYLREVAEFRNVLLAERVDADFAHLMARLAVFATWRLALLDRLATSRDPVLAAIGAKGVKEVSYHREYAAQWVVRMGDGTPLSHERMQAATDAVWPLVPELFQPHEVELRLAASGVAADPAGLRAEFDTIWQQVLAAATLRPATDDPQAPEGAGRAGTQMPAVGDRAGAPMLPVAGRGEAHAPVADRGELQMPAVAGRGETHASVGGGGELQMPAGLGRAETHAPAAGRDGVHTPALGEILAELQGLARSVPGGVW